MITATKLSRLQAPLWSELDYWEVFSSVALCWQRLWEMLPGKKKEPGPMEGILCVTQHHQDQFTQKNLTMDQHQHPPMKESVTMTAVDGLTSSAELARHSTMEDGRVLPASVLTTAVHLTECPPTTQSVPVSHLDVRDVMMYAQGEIMWPITQKLDLSTKF